MQIVKRLGVKKALSGSRLYTSKGEKPSVILKITANEMAQIGLATRDRLVLGVTDDNRIVVMKANEGKVIYKPGRSVSAYVKLPGLRLKQELRGTVENGTLFFPNADALEEI